MVLVAGCWMTLYWEAYLKLLSNRRHQGARKTLNLLCSSWYRALFRSGNHDAFCAINGIHPDSPKVKWMKDSLVETATPATTSAAPSIQEALDMQRRNFFPFPVLWFSLVALEISGAGVHGCAGVYAAPAHQWKNFQQLRMGRI